MQRFASRLEATLARLEATATFPWHDPLDAVHEENRFQRDTEMLGEEGALLWARFDKEMDRLHATQFSIEARAAWIELLRTICGRYLSTPLPTRITIPPP